MAIDWSAISPPSFSELKQAALLAIGTGLLAGKHVGINNRDILRVTPDEARKIYEWATEMELIASGDAPGGLALVKWGERV